ncbi:putative sodium/dicarboxylate symporter [Sphingobium sp. SYK-6]|uniref:dicarboxylate/amino acid:cation symporter n=1 Tax=Sphingobium sp. (strain NBRC 103272 / SYK-6) TaxID=627192 RepID=UPI000227754C|nr:dicarboxylate/amino acid:cation symporter [Sphingobium sp. SYK-6]BAK66096.1 putative sodium/dicarboxylate symporter [Sphingobium sp. SYK-6]
MRLIRSWFAIPLWKRVIAGLVLGVAFAVFFPGLTPAVAVVGDIFIRLIRMLVVPVVFITIASGVTALGDPKRLGSVGGRTLGLFAVTTAIAVSVGMIVALIIGPGIGANLGSALPHEIGTPKSTYDQLVGIIPINIIEALAAGDMLAIIFFSLLLGVGTILAGEGGRPLANLLQSGSNVLFHIIRLVMEVTPFGVFALTAGAIATNGFAVFANIGLLALCVVIGSLIQVVFVHSLLVRGIARMRLSFFFRGIMDALAVAFSTASSSATLPVALRVARDNLRIAPAVASTVLPIGASIGKDGTAMYVGLLSIFSLQALGIQPDAGMLAVILFTGALAAFGTAPIPSASLFMLAAVLSAVGVSTEQAALIVGFVLPFDRLLDMTRTVPSACANLAVTTAIAHWEGDLARSDG